MRMPANRSRLLRQLLLLLVVATAAPSLSAYPPTSYYFVDTPDPNEPPYPTRELACERLNSVFRGSWSYDEESELCLDRRPDGLYARTSVLTRTWRCAPHGDIPNDHVPWKEQCGGPFFWSHDKQVSRIEDQSCPVGNGVTAGTGTMTITEPDIPATTHVPALERTYRSHVPFDAADTFGRNWMHQWNRQLELPGENGTTLTALRGDATHVTFNKQGDSWQSASSRDTVAQFALGNGENGWQYRRAVDDAVETYDARGRLLRVAERNGQLTTLTYSDASTPAAVAGKPGMLLRVANRFDQAYVFTYDSQGRINSITDPSQRTTWYKYGERWMLSEVTHADGTRRKYHYDAMPGSGRFARYLTGITDEAGVRFSTYSYDGHGRVTNTELADGVDFTSHRYFDANNTTVYRRKRRDSHYRQEMIGNTMRPVGISGHSTPGGATKSTYYDPSGNLVGTVNFKDVATQYAYDERGRVTRRVEQAGSPAQEIFTTEWHPTLNVPARIAMPNRIDTAEFDELGRPSRHSWQATTDSSGMHGFNAERTGPVSSIAWTYDANWQMASLVEREDDRITSQATFTYDAQGNLASATDSTGRTSRGIAYDGSGRLLEGINPDGVRIKYLYDARGRPIEYHYGRNVTTYTYDAVGQRIGLVTPHGKVVEFKYDSVHRLVDVIENGKSLRDPVPDVADQPDAPAAASDDAQGAAASDASAAPAGIAGSTDGTATPADPASDTPADANASAGGETSNFGQASPEAGTSDGSVTSDSDSGGGSNDSNAGATPNGGKADPAPNNFTANPFKRWFGWFIRFFGWLFGSAHAHVSPAASSTAPLGAPTSMPGIRPPLTWDDVSTHSAARKPWQWFSIWTQRLIDACLGKQQKVHAGQMHALGPGYPNPAIGDSERWGPQDEPPSASNGVAMLYALEARMTEQQLIDRTDALVKARRYVMDSPAQGGAYPPGKSFRGVFDIRRNSQERIDVEIQSGPAFVKVR